jgi:hypothetical protein
MGCTDSKEVDERSEQSPGAGQRGRGTAGTAPYRTPSRSVEQEVASGRRSQGSARRREICPCYLTGYCAAGDACPDLHVELNQVNSEPRQSGGHRSLGVGSGAVHVVAVPRESVRLYSAGGVGATEPTNSPPGVAQSPPPYPSYYNQGTPDRLGYASPPSTGPDEPVVVFDDDSPEDREERALQAALALSIAQANREEAERQRLRAGVEASSETGLREALRRSALEDTGGPSGASTSPSSSPPRATVQSSGVQGVATDLRPPEPSARKQRSFPPNTSVTRIKRLFPMYRYKSTPQRGTELVQFPTTSGSPTREGGMHRNSTRSESGVEIEFEGDSEAGTNGVARDASERDYSNPDSEGGNGSFGSGLQVAAPPPVPLTAVAEDGDDCAICFINFLEGDEILILPCTHRFHGDCVAKWLTKQASCPTCNWSVFDDGRSKLRPH